jgi:hypothetical protein
VSRPPSRRAATRGTTGGVTSRPRPRPRAESAIAVEDDQLVEVSELTPLALALHESTAAQLAQAKAAVTAAGHAVVLAGHGEGGAAAIAAALRAGAADQDVDAIDAVLVGLPTGEPILAAALALAPRRPVIIVAPPGGASDGVPRAVEVGADLCALRPHDLDRLAPVLLAGARLAAERLTAATARGTEAALRARLAQFTNPEPRALQPFELFQRVLELELRRARRYQYPLSVALLALEPSRPPAPAGVRGLLRGNASAAIVHSIRDIDLATALDLERYLVLLPYTPLDGAAGVARRIIAAAASEPVVAAGRRLPTKLIGAVAGTREGQVPSFARLMKDAMAALALARAEGAELAVAP